MTLFLLIFGCQPPQPPEPPIDSQGRLQPLFWRHFQGGYGCRGIHLNTWNPEGTIGMDISIPGLPDDREIKATFNIERQQALIMVETGREIPVNFCVDKIAEIPVQKVYHSLSGTVDLEIIKDHDGYYASAQLSDIMLQSEMDRHEIKLSTIVLPNIRLDKIKTQTPGRKLLQDK